MNVSGSVLGTSVGPFLAFSYPLSDRPTVRTDPNWHFPALRDGDTSGSEGPDIQSLIIQSLIARDLIYKW